MYRSTSSSVRHQLDRSGLVALEMKWLPLPGLRGRPLGHPASRQSLYRLGYGSGLRMAICACYSWELALHFGIDTSSHKIAD
jgi:hypothetical protein